MGDKEKRLKALEWLKDDQKYKDIQNVDMESKNSDQRVSSGERENIRMELIEQRAKDRMSSEETGNSAEGTIRGYVTEGGTVTEGNVTEGNVTGGNVTGGNVTGENVTGGNVTGENVTGGNVTGENVTGGTVTEGNVTGENVTGGNVTGENVTGGTVTEGNVTGENVTGGNVTGENVTGGNVTGENVTRGNVTGENVTRGNVTRGNVTGGNVTGENVTSGNVTRGNVIRGNVTRGNVTGENVTSGNVTRGNVIRGNVTRGNVTGGNVTGGNVTGGNVTRGNVTGGNVTRGNVTRGNVTRGNVTGGNVTEEGNQVLKIRVKEPYWKRTSTNSAEFGIPSIKNEPVCYVRNEPLTMKSPYFELTAIGILELCFGLRTSTNAERELSITYSFNGELCKNGALKIMGPSISHSDRMGCGIKFEKLSEETSFAEPLSVFFTKGGKEIGCIDFFCHGLELYPSVAYNAAIGSSMRVMEENMFNIIFQTIDTSELVRSRSGNNATAGQLSNGMKYHEVHSKTDIKNALGTWELKSKYSLVLSFCGEGGKTCAYIPHNARYALVQLIRYTGAIVTCSTSGKAASIVKQIIKDVHAVSGHKPNVLGVFSLPSDRDREIIKSVIESVCGDSSNKHFTHFIFVDNSSDIETYHKTIDTHLSEGVERNDFIIPALNIIIEDKFDVEKLVHPVLIMKPDLTYDKIIETFKFRRNPMIDYFRLSIFLQYNFLKSCRVLGQNVKIEEYDINNYTEELFIFLLEQDEPDAISLLVDGGFDVPRFTESLRKKENKGSTLFTKFFDWGQPMTELSSYLYLFARAIENEKYNTAVALGNFTESAMTSSLVAVICIKDKLKHEQNYEKKNVLQTHVKTFNDIALRHIDMCYTESPSKTEQCLVCRRANFRNVSTILLAQENKEFINHPACRSKIDNIWNGDLCDETEFKVSKLLICLVCPFLACLCFPTNHCGCGCRLPSKDSMCCKFIHCPRVKHTYSIITYIIFLCVFACTLVSTKGTAFSIIDGVLVFFVINFAAEELRKIAKKKYDMWTVLDISAIVIFVIGTCFQKTCCFEVGVMFLAIDYILFSVRLFHELSGLWYIGPKLVMIYKMFKELWYFLIILMVVVVSNGVAMQTIMYPSSSISWKTAFNIFRISFFSIFAVVFLDELEGEFDCAKDEALWMNGTLPRCPTTFSRHAVPIMLGVYLLIVRIMLLSLLIALFNFKIAIIQKDAEKYWRYLRYKTVKEYHDRPWVCPSFMAIYYPIYFVYYLVQSCREKCRKNTNNRDSKKQTPFCREPDEMEMLQHWEYIQNAVSIDLDLKTVKQRYKITGDGVTVNYRKLVRGEYS